LHRRLVIVHYGGIPCEIDEIYKIANKYGLLVLEDAAQGIEATYKGRPLGSTGQLGALSFHETKIIISGESGALIVNDKNLLQ
jgi:dTDP-4-amino-4,6-dideoxygalactose transaminase